MKIPKKSLKFIKHMIWSIENVGDGLSQDESDCLNFIVKCLEKEIPVKIDECAYDYIGFCPICKALNKNVNSKIKATYCCSCGQKLNWEIDK